jgi:hypothetical protein
MRGHEWLHRSPPSEWRDFGECRSQLARFSLCNSENAGEMRLARSACVRFDGTGVAQTRRTPTMRLATRARSRVYRTLGEGIQGRRRSVPGLSSTQQQVGRLWSFEGVRTEAVRKRWYATACSDAPLVGAFASIVEVVSSVTVDSPVLDCRIRRIPANAPAQARDEGGAADPNA